MYVTLAFANILTAGALIFTALAFATDHWIDITIRRDDIAKADPSLKLTKLQNNKLYFTRSRGLFRTCYEGDTVCK